MDQIYLVVPVLPGCTADVGDFMRELETGRNADCQRLEQRIGIVKETWYFAPPPRAGLNLAKVGRCIKCRGVFSIEMSGRGAWPFTGSGPLLAAGAWGAPVTLSPGAVSHASSLIRRPPPPR